MAEDQPVNKKRAEILFDVLRGQDPIKEPTYSHPGNDKNDSSNLSNIEYSKPKDSSENPSGNIVKEANNDVNMVQVGETSNYKGFYQEIVNRLSVKDFCSGLQVANSLPIRCHSALSLAVLCRSPLSREDSNLIFNALHIISDQHTFYALSFCQALLLYMLTKQNLTPEQIGILEKSILKVAHSVIQSDGILGNNFVQARIILLGGQRYLTACRLCKEIFPEKNLDVNSLDVTSICCASFSSLSKLTFMVSGRCKFSDATLKYVLNMVGISTQEIISENLIDMEEEEEIITVSSYTVYQCLQALEKILLVDHSSVCKKLLQEEFSLMRCLTKLLEWSLLSIFPQETSENNSVKEENSLQVFHRKTLVSILRVFTFLSLDREQCSQYTNMKGTMEKIMICIFKTWFETPRSDFEILALALELLINLALNRKKTFGLLCVKNFQMNSEEKELAIETLLKIVVNSLCYIDSLKSGPTGTDEESDSEPEELEEQEMEYLKAADEDLERSTIISFIGILLMIFTETKKSFKEFVRKKFSVDQCSDTVAVMKKSLQFTLFTGGMNSGGMRLLKIAMKKLEQLHSSS